MPNELQDLVFDHLLDHTLVPYKPRPYCQESANLQSGIQSHIDLEIEWGDRRAGAHERQYPVFDAPHFMKRNFAQPKMVAALVERARYKILRKRECTFVVQTKALLHFGTAHSRAFGVPLAGFHRIDRTVQLNICPKEILGSIRNKCKRLWEKDW